MLENSPELVVSLFAILKAGAVFVPVSPTTKTGKRWSRTHRCARTR